jgi:hypothetical protein
MGDQMTVEQWLRTRKEAGLQIDPETAEVDWWYAQTLDPYGVGPNLPEEYQRVGREYFACAPGSDVWVWFGDLPTATERALWEKHKSKLAFPAVERSCAGLKRTGLSPQVLPQNLRLLSQLPPAGRKNRTSIGPRLARKSLVFPVGEFGYVRRSEIRVTKSAVSRKQIFGTREQDLPDRNAHSKFALSGHRGWGRVSPGSRALSAIALGEFLILQEIASYLGLLTAIAVLLNMFDLLYLRRRLRHLEQTNDELRHWIDAIVEERTISPPGHSVEAIVEERTISPPAESHEPTVYHKPR